jgi:hypothetical protein
MAYSAHGKLAKAVCEAIGWDYDTRPVAVMRRGRTIYATGTLLKPDEWRRLAAEGGLRVEYEGEPHTLRITGIPRGL